MMSEFCPKCGSVRAGAFRFCRSCQFDFDADPELVGGVGRQPVDRGLRPAAPSASVGPPVSPATNREAKPAMSRNGKLALVLVAVLAVLVAMIMYGGTVNGPAGAGIAAPAVPPIDGLADWHTNLGVTTCAEYTNSMTPADQAAAAAWMLAILRRTEVSDASDGAEFAVRFAGQITAACAKYYGSAPTTGVIAGATMAYTNDSSLHPLHH
jgi:hypothetical protein